MWRLRRLDYGNGLLRKKLLVVTFCAEHTEEDKGGDVGDERDNRKHRGGPYWKLSREAERANLLDSVFVAHLVKDHHSNDTAQDASEGDEVVEESEFWELLLAAD